jgi:hypothetical protein
VEVHRKADGDAIDGGDERLRVRTRPEHRSSQVVLGRAHRVRELRELGKLGDQRQQQPHVLYARRSNLHTVRP